MSNSGKRKIMQQHGKKENYGTVSIPVSMDGSFGAKIAALWTGIEHKLSLEINFSPRFARDIIMSIKYCYHGAGWCQVPIQISSFCFQLFVFVVSARKEKTCFLPRFARGSTY